jgi:hypothetical protein
MLLSSEFAQVNAPSTGLKNQRLPSPVEGPSEQAFSQFALDGQRQFGGHAPAAGFRVDVQREGLVQRHRNSSARGVEATIFLRLAAERSDDRASGGRSVNGTLDAIYPDRAAAGPDNRVAGEIGDFNPTAGGFG